MTAQAGNIFTFYPNEADGVKEGDKIEISVLGEVLYFYVNGTMKKKHINEKIGYDSILWVPYFALNTDGDTI